MILAMLEGEDWVVAELVGSEALADRHKAVNSPCRTWPGHGVQWGTEGD